MSSLRKLQIPALLLIGALIGNVALSEVSAQLGLANTVASPGQTISSSTWTTNFTSISNLALNRTGGVVTGNITWSGDSAHDLGQNGASRPRDLWLGRNASIGGTLGVTGASTFAALSGTTLTLSNTGASAFDVAGGINAGSGNVGIVGTDGRIPAISATYFASLSGADLTGIPETAITDGSLLSRVADAETFSGAKTFTANPTFSTTLTQLKLSDTNSGSDEKNWIIQADNSQFNIASATDAAPTTALASAFQFARSGTNIDSIELRTGAGGSNPTRTSWSNTGTLTHSYALVLNGVISPSALSADVDDYNPTGLSTASFVRVITNDTTARAINGIAGGAAGRTIRWCNVGTSGVNGTVNLAGAVGSSTAANRISVTVGIPIGNCVVTVYDGVSSLWRPEV